MVSCFAGRHNEGFQLRGSAGGSQNATRFGRDLTSDETSYRGVPDVLVPRLVDGENEAMDADLFLDKLFEQSALSAVDFACDLEKVLAEQVVYLRRVIEAMANDERLQRDELVKELRGQIAGRDEQLSELREQNALLRARLLAYEPSAASA